MEPQHRLRVSAEFERTRREGRSWAHPLMVLNAVPNDLGVTRCGFTVSKRVGNAVVRNRVRRRLREIVRRSLPTLDPNWDLVLVARSGAAHASFEELQAAYDALIARARVRPTRRTGPDGQA